MLVMVNPNNELETQRAGLDTESPKPEAYDAKLSGGKC